MPANRHLNPEELLTAAEGDISSDIRAHLVGCARCTREVTRLNQILSVMSTDTLESAPDPALNVVFAMLPPATPRPTLLQRIEAVLRMDSNSGALAFGMRSAGSAGQQMLFSAGDYEIDVRVTRDKQGWALLGQVLGSATFGSIRLSNQNRTFTGDINELGEFSLTGVPSGSYTFTLVVGDSELEIKDFRLE
jgi:hypothetical protein